MSAERTALAIFLAVQVLGAMPDVPVLPGWFGWLLKWIHDAAQAIARNKDKIS